MYKNMYLWCSGSKVYKNILYIKSICGGILMSQLPWNKFFEQMTYF